MKNINEQEKARKQVSNPWLFWFFLLRSLPLGWLVGLRIRSIDENICVTSVPFKWWTKNPFKSMYFAVQSMAAELSTAAFCIVAIKGHHPSIAFIIVDMTASFYKKATGRVFFTCEEGSKATEAVRRCIKTGEAHQATFKTTGKMKDGTLVSEFKFTWSFKQRK